MEIKSIILFIFQFEFHSSFLQMKLCFDLSKINKVFTYCFCKEWNLNFEKCFLDEELCEWIKKNRKRINYYYSLFWCVNSKNQIDKLKGQIEHSWYMIGEKKRRRRKVIGWWVIDCLCLFCVASCCRCWWDFLIKILKTKSGEEIEKSIGN